MKQLHVFVYVLQLVPHCSLYGTSFNVFIKYPEKSFLIMFLLCPTHSRLFDILHVHPAPPPSTTCLIKIPFFFSPHPVKLQFLLPKERTGRAWKLVCVCLPNHGPCELYSQFWLILKSPKNHFNFSKLLMLI